MAAKKKPLESKPAQLGAVRVTVQKAELPPERPAGRIIGEGVGRRARARPSPPDRGEGALMANVLVFAETRGAALRKVALEAVTAARALADASGGGEVHALVAGAPGVGAAAEQLGAHGADVVYVVEHAGFAHVRARVDRGDGRASAQSRAAIAPWCSASRRRGATSGRGSPRSSMRPSRRT